MNHDGKIKVKIGSQSTHTYQTRVLGQHNRALNLINYSSTWEYSQSLFIYFYFR